MPSAPRSPRLRNTEVFHRAAARRWAGNMTHPLALRLRVMRDRTTEPRVWMGDRLIALATMVGLERAGFGSDALSWDFAR